MIWLLVISSLMIAIYGSREHWLCKQCPFCRLMVMGKATKCEHCHEWLPKLLLVAGLLLWAQPSVAQGINLVPCPGINFFGEACETEMEPAPVRVVTPPVASPMPPLFRKDEMAHDTPQLMLDLLQNPTPEAAKRFVAWQEQRLAS